MEGFEAKIKDLENEFNLLDEESSSINFINQQDNIKKKELNEIINNTEDKDEDSDDQSVVSMTWKIS